MGFNGYMDFIYPTQLCPPQTHPFDTQTLGEYNKMAEDKFLFFYLLLNEAIIKSKT